jgi:ABC-type multidrug transport system ATPase subunit
VLAIRNLSKTYPNGTRALKGVTLDIPRGMFGLLGPNGSGKSTLMRTLATLQDADQGQASLESGGRVIDLLADHGAVRRLLGYLPQDFGVYPKVSAIDMLDHFANLKGFAARSERRSLVESLLRQVNLWDVRKKALGSFSGGMKQRFGIAQALIGSPELIIVDEPTAGLDPEERLRFHNLLAEIGENVVVILSGAPHELLALVEGKVWRKTIPRGEVEEAKQRHAILSTRMVAGQTVIHVHAEADPGDGFEADEANLEDVYFAAIRGIVRNGDGAAA